MGCLTESTWTPRSKFNVDTKNQLADLQTKSSFTRGEGCHLLRFFNIMNFSMSSCSHFLSNKKQSIMSKRAQERGSEEGPAAAQPSSARLVSRNLLSAWQTSSRDSGAVHVPVNQEFGQNSVSGSTKTLVQSGVCAGVQGVSGNWCDVLKTNLQGQVWTSTTRRSPTIHILRKSSRISDRNRVFRKMLMYPVRRPMYWSCDCLRQQRWKHQFMLGPVTMKM